MSNAGIWLCSVKSSFKTSSQGTKPPRSLQPYTTASQNCLQKPRGIAAPSAQRQQMFVSLGSQQKSDKNCLLSTLANLTDTLSGLTQVESVLPSDLDE